MKCKILHETTGRMRVHLSCPALSLRQADLLEYWLRAADGVENVKVYDRTGDAVVFYHGSRAAVTARFASFSFEKAEAADLVPEHTTRALNREFEDRLISTVLFRGVRRFLIPAPVRMALTLYSASKYLRAGLRSLCRGKLTVDVLDATTITISLIRGDFSTAGSVMFMLRIGELLEDWTHKKSVADLAGVMSLGVDKVWKVTDHGEELVPVTAVQSGDLVVVRTGNMIPLDGKVTEGEASVNQASMTGESMPIPKHAGSYVYAGTVVEEGECVIRVEQTAGQGRYDRIVRMIEESEKLKSTTENNAAKLADKLVPYTFAGAGLTWLFTRNVTKALAVLMVDFSCALKLSMPIAVLSAMREGHAHHLSVKGGKFLEAIANADTVVFDKTGTLTWACPRVAQIVTFGGKDEDEMLRLAACLEEHYPHSMANAVVNEAAARGLNHEEYHSSVEYVVAHGISSSVNGEKVIIGSSHFVFEDEGCVIPAGEEAAFAALPAEYSHLYLCISGVLAAVICISDPLRAEAAEVIQALHACGIRHTVMMTGDNRATAAAVAARVGVDDFRAEVLPQDKADYIRQARANGHTVIMIGDGVNDSPALSEADVGIAISTGAAIAREIADVTVSSESLWELVTLRRLSTALMARIQRNYRTILGFNLGLICLGIAGILPPTTSAFLHNASTLAISMKSMTNLLK